MQKAFRFLASCETHYLLIGGLASSALGEPRLTADLDLLLYVHQSCLPQFLDSAKKAGFGFDEKKVMQDAADRLCFEMEIDHLHVDCLIAATAFEAEALTRSITIKFEGHALRLPSPEDLILLKLIVGRDKDLLDAKSIALKHKDKLETAYMRGWAETFKASKQDSLVLERLNKLLAG
ncbi:MAG: hypothetical protein AABZ44_03940 [Elusimicrobiota bacterium]